MKRMIVAAVLALAALAGSQQRASAWVKWNFTAGINWCYEGGGNSILWGAYQSSPYPGCGVPGCVLNGQPFGSNFCCPGGVCAAPGYPAGGYPAPAYAAAPNAAAPVQVQPKATPAATSVNPVSYYAPASYGTTYPYNNYYSGQVPSYWYGR